MLNGPVLIELFYREEAVEYIEIGTINGLFVLGRCTGFIGKLIYFQFFIA